MNQALFIALIVILVLGVLVGVAYIRQYANNEVSVKQCARLFGDQPYPAWHECGERLAARRWIEPGDRVLEVGGGLGSVSRVIAANDPQLLAILEANPLKLLALKKHFADDTRVRVLPYLLSAPGHTDAQHKTIEQIETALQTQFTTLVIDCEGCYKHFWDEMLSKPTIRKVIIEWDAMPFGWLSCGYERSLLQRGFRKVGTYTHRDLPFGTRVYIRST